MNLLAERIYKLGRPDKAFCVPPARMFIRRATVLYFVAVGLLSGVAGTCAKGWVGLPQEDTCILVVSNALPYASALKDCESKGGTLVKITDAFMNSAVVVEALTFLNNRATYIGVHKLIGELWEYSDGSYLKFAKWKPNEPSSQFSCAALDPNTSSWMAVNCSSPLPYVCSKLDNKKPCDDAWQYFVDNDSCYYVSNTTMTNGPTWDTYTFFDAEAACKKMSAELVSIHSEAEDAFVFGIVSTSGLGNQNASAGGDACVIGRAWIGLTYTLKSSKYAWTDGTPVDYLGIPVLEGNSNEYYSIINDKTCAKEWAFQPLNNVLSRFVCKKLL